MVDHTVSTRRPIAAGLVFAVLELLAPMSARGGQRPRIDPSIQVSTVHDDNVFSSVADRASDRVLRITPAVSLEPTTPRGLFSGSYGIDGEQYARHRQLSTPLARTFANSRFAYRAAQRTSVAVDGTYVRTNTPSEFNTTTAVATARMRALRLGAGSSVMHRLSQTFTASAAYRATHDTLENDVATKVRVAIISLERTLTRRDRVTLDYEASRYGFQSTPDVSSHAVHVGWTSKLGTRTDLQFRGGPRETAGAPAADVRASVNHQLEASRVTMSYERTQTTVLGVVGPVAVQSLQARAEWSPTRSLTGSVDSAVFRTVNARFGANVFHTGLNATYTLTKSLALAIAYTADTQHLRQEPQSEVASPLRHRSLLFGVAVK